MTDMKLWYFDAPVSRGEECRIALHVAGVKFEDVRIKGPDWPAKKAETPFGAVPVLEVGGGRPPLAQSNAILVYVGREHGLHPKDAYEAARHEMMLEHCEDLRHLIGPTMRIKDAAERKAAREALVADDIPRWMASAEKQLLGDGPFFGRDLSVVDVKLFVLLRWLLSGVLDHIPASVVTGHARLVRLHDAVRDDARVKSWTNRA